VTAEHPEAFFHPAQAEATAMRHACARRSNVEPDPIVSNREMLRTLLLLEIHPHSFRVRVFCHIG
jgi:hypothetical protein